MIPSSVVQYMGSTTHTSRIYGVFVFLALSCFANLNWYALSSELSPSVENSVAQGIAEPTIIKDVTTTHEYATQNSNGNSKNCNITDNSSMTCATKTTDLIATTSEWPGSFVKDLADPDQRLVLFVISCGYIDFLDNCIASMKLFDVSNYCIVPLDRQAERISQLYYPGHVTDVPSFLPPKTMVHKPVDITRQEFKDLTSSRPRIIESFVELGIKVFYCDVDVVWQSGTVLDFFDSASQNQDTAVFRETQPLPNSTIEVEQANRNKPRTYDIVAMVDTGDVSEGKICSGMMYFAPTNTTMTLLQDWQSMIDTGRYRNDQFALYDAYNQSTDALKKKVLLYPRNNPYFPNGRTFNAWGSDKKAATLLAHNNFLRGKPRKTARFRSWGLWHTEIKSNDLRRNCSS